MRAVCIAARVAEGGGYGSKPLVDSSAEVSCSRKEAVMFTCWESTCFVSPRLRSKRSNAQPIRTTSTAIPTRVKAIMVVVELSSELLNASTGAGGDATEAGGVAAIDNGGGDGSGGCG